MFHLWEVCRPCQKGNVYALSLGGKVLVVMTPSRHNRDLRHHTITPLRMSATVFDISRHTHGLVPRTVNFAGPTPRTKHDRCPELSSTFHD